MIMVQKIGRTLVLVALPIVVAYTLINIYLLMAVHQRRSETDSSFTFNGHKYSKFKDRRMKQSLEARKTYKQIPGRLRDIHGANEKPIENTQKVYQDSSAGEDVIAMKDESVDRMIEKLKIADRKLFFPKYFWNSNLRDLTRLLGASTRNNAKTLPGYADIEPTGEKLPAWKIFHRHIRQFSLYDPDDHSLYSMLINMATLPIVEAEQNDRGTQLNVIARFSDAGRAIMKFMRYPREVEADENVFVFDDMERHVAEIAAYHLDNFNAKLALSLLKKSSVTCKTLKQSFDATSFAYLFICELNHGKPNYGAFEISSKLGFYRVPPTIGRVINITSELIPIMPDSLLYTLFSSPAGNLCFYGKCNYFCDSQHAFCGHPNMIEVSLQNYLPSRNVAERDGWQQPWKRSYSKHSKAYWETHGDLCNKIRNEPPYNNGKVLLDIIDAHTFDFLTGNKNRHGFVTFKDFGNYTFPILYDNGKGFGRQANDFMSILAPLRQCCLIRKSTLLKYVKLYVGPERLSVLMEKALETDPLAPVLIKPHLKALDRRLIKILQTTADCIETHPIHKVVISDNF